MCLAVPLKIIEVNGKTAVAEAVTVSNNLQLKVSGTTSTRVGLNYIRQQYLDLSGIPIGIRRTATEYCVTLPLL